MNAGAKRLFLEMNQREIQPDVQTYNALLRALGKALDVTRVEQIFAHMQKNGPTPDMVTWTALIGAYVRSSMVRAGVSMPNDQLKTCSFYIASSLPCACGLNAGLLVFLTRAWRRLRLGSACKKWRWSTSLLSGHSLAMPPSVPALVVVSQTVHALCSISSC